MTATIRSLALPVLGSFLLFAAATTDAFTNGDAAVYVQQMRAGELSERTTHLGYLLIGAAASAAGERLGVGFPDRALNLLSAFFAAATLGVACWWAGELAGRVAALATALVLATHALFLRHAVHAEVYVVQTGFLVLALALWWRGRALAAGLGLGAAVLVTPSSLLAAPAFAVLRPRPRALALLAVVAGALVLALLAPHLEDFLFGPRGLLGAARAGVDLGRATAKESFEVVFGFLAWLPFAVLGLRALWRRYPRLVLAGGVLWLVAWLLGERFRDVPVQLPTYVLLAIAAGAGVAAALAEPADARRILLLAGGALVPVALVAAARPWSGTLAALPAWLAPATAALLLAAALAALMLRRGRGAVAVLVVACAVANGAQAGFSVAEKSREITAYRAAVLAAGGAASPAALAVGPWSRGILYEHYLYGRSYTGRWLDADALDGAHGEAEARRARQAWRRALAERREVWLLAPAPELETELRARGYRLEPVATLVRARPGAEAAP